MTPLIVKGTLFGLLLLSAAVWDMEEQFESYLRTL